MTYFTVPEQVKRMKDIYPHFEVVADGDWYVRWEGWVQPLMCRYRIRISMILPCLLENVEILSSRPRVEILEPEIYGSVSEPIPHLYKNKTNPDLPLLCLYDPAEEEWGFGDYVAETTVDWAIRWIASYEGWRATGEWKGGGRDHTPSEQERKACQKTYEDRRGSFSKSAFNWIGQKIGTYASLPLMVAASKEYFQSLCWLDWSNLTLEGKKYQNTSTTSAGHLLAVL